MNTKKRIKTIETISPEEALKEAMENSREIQDPEMEDKKGETENGD
jgi:hypothetical protein